MDRLDMIRGFVKKINADLKKAKSHGRVDIGADIKYMDPPRILTGIFAIDILTNGGLPRGMMNQHWGPYSSGKTTVSMQEARAVQETGGINGEPGSVAWAAAEPFSKKWGRKNGLLIPYNEQELAALYEEDPEYAEIIEEDQESWPPFVVMQHSHGDGLLEMVYDAVKSNLFDMVVVDSLAAMQRFADSEEKSMEAQSYGGQAGMYSQFTKKMYSALNTRYDLETMKPTVEADWYPNMTCVMCINQARVTIGGYNPSGRKQLHPTGGEALLHVWGTSIEFKQGPRFHKEERGKKIYYKQQINVKCDKSKVGPPLREADWELYLAPEGDFGAGESDSFAQVVSWAVYFGLVQQNGSWFSYQGEKLGQGFDNALAALRQDDDVYDALYLETLTTARQQ